VTVLPGRRPGPANGGLCTYGVSIGKKVDGDPSYGVIVDGTLDVFLNEAIFRGFQEGVAGAACPGGPLPPRRGT
jgi:hypothetical protein